MSEAIIEALRAMQSDLQQVELLSQNIANQSTPGFRAIETTDRPFDLSRPEQARAATPMSAFNQSGGQLFQTNSEFDVAVTNGGFLAVEGGRDGRVALVRGGVIEFNDAGRATIAGRLLMTTGPAAATANERISLSAQSSEENSALAEFVEIVTVSDTAALSLVAPGVYEVNPEFVAPASNGASLLQGYLEQSNVNSSQVVVQMMELSKHVESVQRAMRAIDEMLGSGINELGR